MFNLKSKLLAITAALLCAGSAVAQDSGALIDLLVKKGVLNNQEAEDLRVELTKDFVANTSAGKLNLSSSIADFKLSGDMRMRHQIETQAPAVASGPTLVTNERVRERFRFRFNGDVTLQKGWTTGFALETGQAADSGNQTFQGGNDDYSLFLARAYIGWQPNQNWSFILGKQKNPIYTTDLVWDADINPQGVSEVYKKFLTGKDTLEVRALQDIMDDRDEKAIGPAGRDAWMFAQQAVYTHYFGRDSIGNQVNSIVLAPGFMLNNQSILANGTTNENAFLGSTRGLALITFAGEVNWMNVNGAGTGLKLYWDFAHNLEASRRVAKVYGLNTAVWNDDPNAWLLGIGYSSGTGKVQGDYGFKLDYRRVGLGSVDVNLNDSDFAFGKLSQQGFKFGATYNVTDFANLGVTYFYTTAMQDNLTYSLANIDHSQLLQVDLVVKF